MTQNPGKPASPADPRALDLYDFAKSGRQAAGALRVSQMPRMLAEVPPDAPDRDSVFTWQAEGSTQPELQDDGTDAPQPYLRLAVHGSIWLTCQRCLAPYSQHLDVDATYRIVATEEEADEYPLDDDEIDVIVGSRQFDLVDLIEEELLLSMPLVPKHNVCPETPAAGRRGRFRRHRGRSRRGRKTESVCGAGEAQGERSGRQEALM
jgi:uncharacterized protein